MPTSPEDLELRRETLRLLDETHGLAVELKQRADRRVGEWHARLDQLARVPKDAPDRARMAKQIHDGYERARQWANVASATEASTRHLVKRLRRLPATEA